MISVRLTLTLESKQHPVLATLDTGNNLLDPKLNFIWASLPL
jgi:hypothetical protein